jgi:hypothetical protein
LLDTTTLNGTVRLGFVETKIGPVATDGLTLIPQLAALLRLLLLGPEGNAVGAAVVTISSFALELAAKVGSGNTTKPKSALRALFCKNHSCGF